MFIRRFYTILASFICCTLLLAQNPYEAPLGSPAMYEPKKFNYNASFSFAVISDLHISIDNQQNSDDLIAVIDDINKQRGIAFVLITGDLTEHGDLLALQSTKQMLDKLIMPYYVIPGNHDTRYTESGGADYRRVFGQDRFRLLMNGYLFVGINTSPMMNGGEGHVSTQDVQWLQRQLKSHGKKNPAFIITHHPLKGGDVSNWFEVTDVARKYNVQGVLSGHYHRNLMDNYDAIPGIINRSMQRGKIGVPAYVIYAMSDSLYMIEKSVGEEAEKWGALALQPRVYTESDSKLKPNFNVNNRYKQVKRDWDIVTGSSIFSSAASSEKLLFYATNEGTVHAISKDKGREQWKYQSRGRVVSKPAYLDGKVLFTSTDNYIYCLNADNGQLIWKVENKRPLVASPTLANGVAYVGASDSMFRALSLHNGETMWRYDGVEGFVQQAPLVTEELILFVTSEHKLYALNRSNGSLAWLQERVTTLPVLLAGNQLATVGTNNKPVIIDLKSGHIMWDQSNYKLSKSIGVSDNGHILYARTTNDSILALNTVARMPAVVWESVSGMGKDKTNNGIISFRDWIILSGKAGEVIALNKQNGEVAWRHKVSHSTIHQVLPISDNELIITSVDGRIVKLSVK